MRDEAEYEGDHQAVDPGARRCRDAEGVSDEAAVAGELALAAFAAETGRHVLSEPSDVRYARFCRRFDEEAFRVRLAAAGMRWLGRSDPAFPSSLRSIFDPPVGLFLRGGGDAALLERPAVAIVGARACSPYGSHVARTFGRELAAAGLVVVSGMARGVDGEAVVGGVGWGVVGGCRGGGGGGCFRCWCLGGFAVAACLPDRDSPTR